VLGISLQFFEIQRSGKISTQDRHIWWRQDAMVNQTYTYGSKTFPIAGGYYDNFGFVKSSYSTAMAATMLAWSMLEFGGGYAASNQLAYAGNTVRWGTSYLMQAIVYQNATANTGPVVAFVAQVGDPAKDRLAETWTRPEDYKAKATVSILDSSKPGSDVAGSASAALAAAATALLGINKPYALKLWNNSFALYEFAKKYPGYYTSNGKVSTGGMYPSQSTYDDLAWAAIWSNKACSAVYRSVGASKTNIDKICGGLYLEAVRFYAAWLQNEQPLADLSSDQVTPGLQASVNRAARNPYVFNYENVGWGVSMLLYNSAKKVIQLSPAPLLTQNMCSACAVPTGHHCPASLS
jgi:hypothetical protein